MTETRQNGMIFISLVLRFVHKWKNKEENNADRYI